MLITQADLARAAEVSRKSVTAWKARGTVVMQGEMVDVEATLAAMRRSKRGGPALADKVTAGLGHRVTGNSPSVTGNSSAAPKVTRGGKVTDEEDDDPYPCRDHLTDPFDRAAVALLPHTAYRIGGAAALAAHELGMVPETAEQLRLHVATAAMEIVGMILGEAGVQPPPGAEDWSEVALFDADKVATVDWIRRARP